MDILELRAANPAWLVKQDGPCWYATRGTTTLQAGGAESLQAKIADADRGIVARAPYARRH